MCFALFGCRTWFLTVRNESTDYRGAVIICTPNGQPDNEKLNDLYWGMEEIA